MGGFPVTCEPRTDNSAPAVQLYFNPVTYSTWRLPTPQEPLEGMDSLDLSSASSPTRRPALGGSTSRARIFRPGARLNRPPLSIDAPGRKERRHLAACRLLQTNAPKTRSRCVSPLILDTDCARSSTRCDRRGRFWRISFPGRARDDRYLKHPVSNLPYGPPRLRISGGRASARSTVSSPLPAVDSVACCCTVCAGRCPPGAYTLDEPFDHGVAATIAALIRARQRCIATQTPGQRGFPNTAGAPRGG